MGRFIFALVFAVVEASMLDITYQDCGAEHAQVTDLQPSFIHSGAPAVVTGTGTLDEDVTSAHITVYVSALGTKITECSGDGTKDIVCQFHMGVGNMTVKAVSFPIAKGNVSIPVEVWLPYEIPSSLSVVTTHVAAEDQNGESVICLDVHTAPGMKEDMKKGACTSDEQSVLGDAQTVGKQASDCGTSAYNIFTGTFNHDKFNHCFSSSMGISNTCSECYAVTGEYGAKNCKADCLLGWCNAGCLSCTMPAQEDLAVCAGFTPPTAEPCDETAKAGEEEFLV
jgi:hypothetical protein